MTKAFPVSNFLSFELADAAAAGVGGTVIMDDDRTLGSDYTTTCRGINFLSGGILDLGGYNLTGTKQAIVAPQGQIFSLSGGALLGTFLIDCWRPEHFSGVPGQETETAAKANAAATGAALTAIRLHAQQSNRPGTPIRISGYYASNAENIFSNVRVAGDFPALIGDGIGMSRLYRTDDSKHLWGVETDWGSIGHPKAIVQDIALYGVSKSSGVSLVENRGCVFVYPERVAFRNCAAGYSLNNYHDGTYCEYSRPRDVLFSDCKTPIQPIITNGTASFHGAGADRAYWTRKSSDDANLCEFPDEAFPYNTHWEGTIWNVDTGSAAAFIKWNSATPLSLSGTFKIEGNQPTSVFGGSGVAFLSPVNSLGVGSSVVNGKLIQADYYCLAGSPAKQFWGNGRVPQRRMMPVSGDNDLDELVIGDARETWVEIYRGGSNPINYFVKLIATKKDGSGGGNVKVIYEKDFIGNLNITWSSPYQDGTIRFNCAALDGSATVLYSTFSPGVISA